MPLLKVRQPEGANALRSVVICEDTEDILDVASMYPKDALSRAQQRGRIEFATPTYADAWRFLNPTDRLTADAKKAAFRERLQRLEAALGAGPYFAGADFRMVDAMFGPGDFSGRSSQAVAHRYRS